MKYHRMRSAIVFGCALMASLVWSSNSAWAVFVAVKDYDANTNDNTVDTPVVPGGVNLSDFKTLVANAFDAGLGGVINFDSASDVGAPLYGTDAAISNPPRLDTTFASGTKTLTLSRDGGTFVVSAQTGTPISGNRVLAHGSGASGDWFFSLDGTTGADANPAPLVAWGISGISRGSDRIYTFTFTLSDSTTVKIGPETVAAANDDTFFGFVAPAGKTISKINLVSGSSNLAFDDMAFVIVPEPASSVLIGIGLSALGLVWAKKRKSKAC